LHFLYIFSKKNAQISNVMKIRPVGAEVLYVDRQTDRRRDMKELIVAFSSFVKAPKTEAK